MASSGPGHPKSVPRTHSEWPARGWEHPCGASTAAPAELCHQSGLGATLGDAHALWSGVVGVRAHTRRQTDAHLQPIKARADMTMRTEELKLSGNSAAAPGLSSLHPIASPSSSLGGTWHTKGAPHPELRRSRPCPSAPAASEGHLWSPPSTDRSRTRGIRQPSVSSCSPSSPK